jgi:hypothetical protein
MTENEDTRTITLTDAQVTWLADHLADLAKYTGDDAEAEIAEQIAGRLA